MKLTSSVAYGKRDINILGELFIINKAFIFASGGRVFDRVICKKRQKRRLKTRSDFKTGCCVSNWRLHFSPRFPFYLKYEK